MQVFDTQRVKAGMGKVRLDKTKDGKRIAKVEFNVPLNKTNTKSSPAFIKTAFEAVSDPDGAMARIELDRAITKQNLTIFAPQTETVLLRVLDVDLMHLAVERSVGLEFLVEMALDDTIGRALTTHYMTTVALELEPAQPKLNIAIPQEKVN